MGHSYIEFRQKMVLINDSAINSLIRMIRLKYRIFVSEFGSDCPIHLEEQFQQWIDAWDNSAVGCIDLELDKTICSDEQLRYLSRFLDEVEATVKSFGEFVPRAYLVQIIGPTCRGPVRVAIVLRDLYKLRSLLQGELANGVIPIPADLQEKLTR